MFIKLKTATGKPLLVAVANVKAITVHEAGDAHENCGTLYLKGEPTAAFHIANPLEVIASIEQAYTSSGIQPANEAEQDG